MFKDLLINLLILLASTKEFESVISYVMYSVENVFEEVWFKTEFHATEQSLWTDFFEEFDFSLFFEFLNVDLVLPSLPDYAYT